MGMVANIYVGSVKTIAPVTLPAADRFGIAVMDFSDDYSVFDWGKMPDRIKDKGAALCMMSSYFFEKIKSAGVPTHYIALLDGNIRKRTDEILLPAGRMEILPILRGEI